jgi:hypothetical protein
MSAWHSALRRFNRDQGFKYTLLNDLIGLIEQSAVPHDFTCTPTCGYLFQAFCFDEDCIAKEERTAKFPISDGSERQCVHHWKMTPQPRNPR